MLKSSILTSRFWMFVVIKLWLRRFEDKHVNLFPWRVTLQGFYPSCWGQNPWFSCLCSLGCALHGDLCVCAAPPAVALQCAGAALANTQPTEAYGGGVRPLLERDQLSGDGALDWPQPSVQILCESELWRQSLFVVLSLLSGFLLTVHCRWFFKY